MISELSTQIETDRAAALSAVAVAILHTQAAQTDGDRAYEAGARVHLACRNCQRVAIAMLAPVEGRRGARRVRAICDLVEQHAQAGIVLAATLRDVSIVNGARKRALLDLLVILADLGYYLDILGRGGRGEL